MSRDPGVVARARPDYVYARRAPARREVLEMPRTPKTPRAQVLALPRPQPVLGAEWLAAAIAVALLLAGLAM